MVKRTDEALWEKIKASVTRRETAGTKAGQWSARKAQLAVLEYKKAGGEYVGPKRETSLSRWTKQDWTTKSGLPSNVTGERYLPRKAIGALTAKQYSATSRAKRKAMKKGEQYSAQPDLIAAIVKEYR